MYYLHPQMAMALELQKRGHQNLPLAMFSSVLAKPQLDWSENTAQTGFTFYEDLQVGGVLSKKLAQFLLEGEDPLIFTLGSTTVVIPGIFYQESIQAAK